MLAALYKAGEASAAGVRGKPVPIRHKVPAEDQL